MKRLQMGGMVFPGWAVAVAGAESRSVIYWTGLILPDFETTVRVSKEE